MSVLTETLALVEPCDPEWRDRARRRILSLAMPPWALGRVLDVAVELAGMTRSLAPPVARRTVVIMAGDHGVTAEGVSAFPAAVTAQMVRGFAAGGAAVNVLARQAGARVVVVDTGVAGDAGPTPGVRSHALAPGTGNIARGPAMSHEQAIRSVETGISVAHDLAADTDVFATGEMGIGNTTPSSAIVAAVCRIDPRQVTGRGTGIGDDALTRKCAVVRRALAVNAPDPGDALDVLAKVGGFEIGGVAGLVIGAASRRRPVLLDGFVATAGALLAQVLCPSTSDYLIAAHRSAEPGHGAALDRLGKTPLLDLGLRLGEGTGAILAMSLVEAAVRILTEMASFEDAGVCRP
jgi:nicotinate-nucleotide--dimethylbenzimidazole phosphoribosyltransferase